MTTNIKQLPELMTPEEIEAAEEASLDAERDWLDSQEKQKQQPKQRTRTVAPRMLRSKEAATYLGVSQWKLRQMVYSGEIECVRQKYWLFAIDDLDKWSARERG